MMGLGLSKPKLRRALKKAIEQDLSISKIQKAARRNFLRRQVKQIELKESSSECPLND